MDPVSMFNFGKQIVGSDLFLLAISKLEVDP